MESYYLYRLLHILFAIIWAGSLMYMAWYVMPTVRKLGPDGGKFMQQLGQTNRLPLFMTGTGTLTVLFGILLMNELSNGFDSAWFSSDYGMIISIGSGLALIAYILGFAINMPASIKMVATTKAIAASGGIPSPEQSATLQKLRGRLMRVVQINAGLVFLAVLLMAGARYLLVLMA